MATSNLSLQAPDISNYIITSPKQRREAGIGSAYVDTYNSAGLQRYQSDLSEYFYNKYNSPAAMANQYEAAGLNRNYASTNTSPASVPSGAGFKSNTMQNKIEAVNTLIGAVAKGVELTSELTNLPKDLAFKEWRNILTAEQGSIAKSRSLSALARAYYDAMYYGGAHYLIPSWTDSSMSWDLENSPAMIQSDLRNSLMRFKIDSAKWDLEHLKPEELKRIQAMIRQIGANAGLSEKTLQWFDTSKFAAIYGPAILSLIRGLM